MPQTKLLILYNKLLHYRIPIFNILAKNYDLTVAYTFGGVPDCDINFKTIKLTPRTFWRFTLQKENIYKLCCGFDAVVVYGETAWLKYSFLALRRHRPFKLIYWCIGAPASYTRPFGQSPELYKRYMEFFAKRGDAQVVYSEAARQYQLERGRRPETVFVANNTVEVPKIEPQRHRDSIIFIGTLYPQKGLPILLDAYEKAYAQNPDLLPLKIVGDGVLRQEIAERIKTLGLEHKITMLGALYKASEKQPVFESAYACISPNQGGLGVLECMGYGVPFITSKNAITGGESFNIETGVTGLRLDTLDNLHEVILDISANPAKYEQMGINAYNYYWRERTPEIMAQGIADAVDNS